MRNRIMYDILFLLFSCLGLFLYFVLFSFPTFVLLLVFNFIISHTCFALLDFTLCLSSCELYVLCLMCYIIIRIV